MVFSTVFIIAGEDKMVVKQNDGIHKAINELAAVGQFRGIQLPESL